MSEFPVAAPAQLASVLRGCRAQAGLTQREAARKVGLLPKTVSALELHPARSSVSSLFKLLSALDIDLVLKVKQSPTAAGVEEAW